MVTTTANLIESTDPRHNGAKVLALETDERGHVDLYRTAVAGPSGQRRAVLVGRVRTTELGPFHYSITDVTSTHARGMVAGYVRWDVTHGAWAVYAVDHARGYGETLEGWTDSLAVAADVVVNGVHAATGRHDSQRISGTFERYVYTERD